MENGKKEANDTGLMAALELINAKGDTGEMTDIVKDSSHPAQQKQQDDKKATLP
ncbi:MAG: hypothetical protein WCC10_11085 [Tumebacillaceae bacterium]